MKTLIISVLIKIFVVSMVLFTLVLTYAYPGGITGRTKKTVTTGCGSCHSNNTSITGSITGPDTVNTGSTVTYTITITRTGSSSPAGCNIAVRSGTLSPGTGLKLQNGELTQTSGWSLSGGTVSRTFTYTAPAAPGIDTVWSTVAVGYSNGFNWSPEKRVVIKGPLKVEDPIIAAQYMLDQNYPNPFNPTTNIRFDIPAFSPLPSGKGQGVRLDVYNSLGQHVTTLVDQQLSPGTYEVEFDGNNMASGIYYYTLKVNDYVYTRKMILLK